MASLWGLLAGRFLSIFVLAKIIEIMSSVDSPAKTLPRILITNDDGIGAKGLRFLLSCVADMGRVRVVAPDSHRSGQSGAITSGVPLTLQPVAPVLGVECYSCNGTPVDCVKLSLHVFPEWRPDIILSGINHGSNSGISIFYSGTMGAVLEGCVVGIPSVGFSSLSHDPDADFSSCRDQVRQVVARVLRVGLPESVCLNVNFPTQPSLGLRVCRQAPGYWTEEYEWRTGRDGREGYFLTGHFVNTEPDAEDTDEYFLARGYTSVVPCTCDQTAYRAMPAVAALCD